MIRIKSYTKSKNNGINTTVINKTTKTSGSTEVNGVKIWGQYHDHTADVSGDLTDVGSITGNGKLTMPTVETNELSAVTGEVDALTSISAEIDSINSQEIYTDTIKVNDTATIENEVVNNSQINTLNAIKAIIDSLTSKDITVDNLTVTKAAHFFKLIIDEIKASQGQLIITPANATIDYVEKQDDGSYTCYWKATDGEKKIYQNFEVNDMVVCQTFNAADGTSYDVSNKFYWRLCTYVSTAPVSLTVDGVTDDYHYIILSDTDKDTNSNGVPAKGDEIVMLGNKSDTERQGAISIGAYNNPYLDKNIKAPFIVQYAGINDYDLSKFRLNVFSNGYNNITGTFTTNNGDNIEDLINNISKGAKPYIHIAYADNATGTVGFTKTYAEGKKYMGMCSNYTESDTDLTYNNYTWVRIKGEDATSEGQYVLTPVLEQSEIGKSKTLTTNLAYYVYRVKGTTVETPTSAELTAADVSVTFYKAKVSGATATITPTQTNNLFKYSEGVSGWTGSNSGDVAYYQVVLIVDGLATDRRIIYPQLKASAVLTITDEINTTVQGHTNQINSNTNSISSLKENYNSISATVNSHTTSINKNKEDIANLTIKADEISTKVQTNSNAIYATTKENRNLVKGTYVNTAFHSYGVCYRSVNLTKGKTYTLTANGRCSTELANKEYCVKLFIWKQDSTGNWVEQYNITFTETDNQTKSVTFTPEETTTYYMNAYVMNASGTRDSTNTSVGIINWWQLEEGDTSTPYTLAKDEKEINDNMLSDSIKDLMTYYTTKDTNGNTIINYYGTLIEDGLTVNDNVTDCVYYSMASTATANYQDVLRKDTYLTLENYETYTLSFYCKGSGTFHCYLYANCPQGVLIDGERYKSFYSANSDTSTGDGQVEFEATSEWTYHTLTWTTAVVSGKKNIIPFRMIKPSTGTSEIYIGAVKLEKGGRDTSYWNVEKELKNSVSEIKQTADSITSTVTDLSNNIIGDNLLEGVGSGYGWTNYNIDTDTYSDATFQTAGFTFTVKTNNRLYSPPIMNYTAQYTLSFYTWLTNFQVMVVALPNASSDRNNDWYKSSYTTLYTLNSSNMKKDENTGRYYYNLEYVDCEWFGLIFQSNNSSTIYFQQIQWEDGLVPHKFNNTGATNQSEIKQTVDNITLNAATVTVKNGDTVSALFEDGKIKTSWLESNTGIWSMNDEGFYYNGTIGNININSQITPNGLNIYGTNKTTVQKMTVSPFEPSSPLLDIVSHSAMPSIRINHAAYAQLSYSNKICSIENTYGFISGARFKTIEASGDNNVLDTYVKNIIISDTSTTTTITLPDNKSLCGIDKKDIWDDVLTYYKDNGKYPECLQYGQEYYVYHLTNKKMTIQVDTTSNCYYPITYITAQSYKENLTSVSENTRYKFSIIFDGTQWILTM